MGIFNRISSGIQNSIAEKFYRIGVLVSTHRWKTIAFTFVIIGICLSGFFTYTIERDPLQLWIPRDSKFLDTTKWLLNNLEIGFRTQKVLITGPNILQPKHLRKILKIHKEIDKMSAKLNNGTEISWNNVCLKIPFIGEVEKKINSRRKRHKIKNHKTDQFSDLFDEADSLTSTPKREFNPSVDLPVPIYCKLVNELKWGCYEKNLLELWKYDEKIIENLTINDIVKKLKNTTRISPVTGHETNYKEQLGGITTDLNGNIIAAKGILIEWLIQLNFTEVRTQQLGNLAGTEDWITEQASVWEDVFLNKIEELKLDLEDGEFSIFYTAGKSFGDISYRTMFKETDKLTIGIIMMFVYILIVLSKFSWVEFRFSLAGIGLLSVALAFISACGICFYLGIPYGPVHTSLPFLLMGLGVDDMFVLMACWRKVESKNLPIEHRVGEMLKHAGASITVTSLTDVIAFVVGSTTVIPSLQSFCLYAAVGVFMTYFYAITFYIAVFTFDEYRIAARRNSLIPCIKHSNEKHMKLFCDLNLMHKFLNKFYGNFILTKPGKVLVILTVIGLTVLSGQNLRNLEQKFDPDWFIPESTYLYKYILEAKRYFPQTGYRGSIFMGNLNYTQSISSIADLVKDIENDNNFNNIQSWVRPFFGFVKKYYYIDLNKTIINDFDWRFYLSKFLHSPNGGKYRPNFRFKTPLECGHPAPDIIASWIDFRYIKFHHRKDYVPAMRNLDELVKSKNFSESGDGFTEVWSKAYANWITDEIIDREVYRNIILASICVMFCTYIVIINFKVCLFIFICVLLTLVNVGGFMQMWGLTIDLVSCIGLQLAVGLCVDYAAHIGHTFLICSDGDRNKRVLDTILHIGAAVLYGGGSTLLSLLLLSQSEAYTFKSFFKIFFLVIVFGLFHGVVLLPVVLSIIGPSPYNKLENTIDEVDVVKDSEELKAMTNNLTTIELPQNEEIKDQEKLVQNEILEQNEDSQEQEKLEQIEKLKEQEKLAQNEQN